MQKPVYLVSQALMTVFHSPALMYVHHLPTISSCRLTRVSRNTRLRIVNKTTAFGARTVTARTEVRITLHAACSQALADEPRLWSLLTDLGLNKPSADCNRGPQSDAAFAAEAVNTLVRRPLPLSGTVQGAGGPVWWSLGGRSISLLS